MKTDEITPQKAKTPRLQKIRNKKRSSLLCKRKKFGHLGPSQKPLLDSEIQLRPAAYQSPKTFELTNHKHYCYMPFLRVRA